MLHVDESAANNQSYTRILKSTTIIGGSSAFNVVFKIVQAKAVAVLIGPTGVGLMGLFNAILGLASTVAGMGLATSGVRQIAEAASSNDEVRIARTVLTFRRVALFFGFLGALFFFIFRQPVAQVTFGNDQYAAAIGWLSLALLLMVVSSAQSTFIRGMQRIGDLARVSVLGIAIGTILGLPLLYFWGEQGVAFYLLLSALTTLLVSWWYARKIPIAKISLAWTDITDEARDLLTLGVIFMITSLVTMATTYLVKVVVTRQLGLEAAGLYEASSALSNVYVGFILAAMGADFFPHLASISHDRIRSTQLINAQVEIGLLIAIPGILAILALGPFLLQILYSNQFVASFEILRWQALATLLRVISWPVGMVTLTTGKGRAFFITELAANLFYMGMAALFVSWLGLPGIGVAFFLMYVFHTIMMTLVARYLIGFSWTGRNLRLMWVFLPVVLAAFFATYRLSPVFSAVVGLVLAICVGIYSLQTMYRLIGPEKVWAYWQRIKTRLGRSRV